MRAPCIKPAEVRRRAERMLEALRMTEAELSVLLCDDAVIQELNRDWRGKDRPTDVLAFAMQEGEGGDVQPLVLGDVVISLETARRQAAAREGSAAAEVTFLLAHGLLHLLGFDHQSPEEERRMHARTDALCAAARAPRSPRRR
jgi:probable rRNA maturation factor